MRYNPLAYIRSEKDILKLVKMCIRDRDIAEFMGLSEKNISVRLTRIREKMKQYLIEREVFV